MKKIFLLFVTSLLFLSCGDEVEFNSPAFQGDRQNLLWRADDFSATVNSSGELTITGSNNIETVNLRIPQVIEGTFVTGETNEIEAEYIDAFGTRFSTNNRPDESVSLYPELGEIIIEEIGGTNSRFTGSFRFLAFDETGLNSIGFTNGVFFKVPLITNGVTPE
ncbi:DUF6252 family protein [Winogradskyella ursingii]|uniref:DUF6252 family protein n=1 Tax=Winogradskyella ursingii TaxID=2686079 RepID=UPI0015CA0FC3|nr:DUF6252 family protein [Winogradskyella ursingii]